MTGIGQIRTIRDLERATYGALWDDQLMKAAGATSGIHNIHDTTAGLSVGDTALHNLIYGQKVWSMLNREINALSILPKKPWNTSGWRVLKERALGGAAATWATTGGTSDGSRLEGEIGGVNEGQVFSTAAPDGTYGTTADEAALSPLKPVWDVLYASPKTIAHQFEITELAAAMAQLDDGIGDLRSAYREEIGVSHAESMNRMALMPLEAMVTSSATTAVGGIELNLTSLYKIVTSAAELEAGDAGVLAGSGSFDYNHGSSNHAEGVWDTLYGKTRSSNAWMDAVVDSGDGNSALATPTITFGSTRNNFTIDVLNSVLRQIQINGGSPKVILTGYDTIQTLGDVLQSQERFMGRTEVMPSHNGVKGVKGREVGFKVATYHDIPIIPVKDMGSTSKISNAAGISDMFVLDTDHLFLCTLKPTEYFEGGIDTGDPFGVGALTNRGLYRTIAELVCTFFKGQGKITNLA